MVARSPQAAQAAQTAQTALKKTTNKRVLASPVLIARRSSGEGEDRLAHRPDAVTLRCGASEPSGRVTCGRRTYRLVYLCTIQQGRTVSLGGGTHADLRIFERQAACVHGFRGCSNERQGPRAMIAGWHPFFVAVRNVGVLYAVAWPGHHNLSYPQRPRLCPVACIWQRPRPARHGRSATWWRGGPVTMGAEHRVRCVPRNSGWSSVIRTSGREHGGRAVGARLRAMLWSRSEQDHRARVRSCIDLTAPAARRPGAPPRWDRPGWRCHRADRAGFRRSCAGCGA